MAPLKKGVCFSVVPLNDCDILRIDQLSRKKGSIQTTTDKRGCKRVDNTLSGGGAQAGGGIVKTHTHMPLTSALIRPTCAYHITQSLG